MRFLKNLALVFGMGLAFFLFLLLVPLIGDALQQQFGLGWAMAIIFGVLMVIIAAALTIDQNSFDRKFQAGRRPSRSPTSDQKG